MLFLILISQIYSLSEIQQEVLTEDHELPKVCLLEDDGVAVLTSLRGTRHESKMCRLDKNGNKIYDCSVMDFSYTGSSEFVKLKNSTNYALYYHNNQNIDGKKAKENILILEDHGKKVNLDSKKQSIYETKSAIGLKNGKIFLAGIDPIPSDYAETRIELNLYNPNTNEWENGLSFDAYSKFVSCFEQKKK